MSLVYLALGSNIEPRLDFLINATRQLKGLGTIKQIAPVYNSSPYGKVDQPDFLNSALILETKLEPETLLRSVKQIEKAVGRRHRERWGPREIDIDIIFYDDREFRSPAITVPHPDYRNRKFVLLPLVDLAADFTPPDARKDLRGLLEECRDTSTVNLVKKDWITGWI